MSKEVMIGMLKVGKTGNDLLQILDAIVGNPPYADSSSDVSFQEAISSYAVDFKGNPTDFWWYWEGAKIPLFVIPYIKDYIKKCIKKHICVVYLFPQCVWKSMFNLWKSVVEKMFLGLVILASSLSHTRRNVKGAMIKIPTQIFAKLSVFLINTDWKIDNIPSPFYTH